MIGLITATSNTGSESVSDSTKNMEFDAVADYGTRRVQCSWQEKEVKSALQGLYARGGLSVTDVLLITVLVSNI